MVKGREAGCVARTHCSSWQHTVAAVLLWRACRHFETVRFCTSGDRARALAALVHHWRWSHSAMMHRGCALLALHRGHAPSFQCCAPTHGTEALVAIVRRWGWSHRSSILCRCRVGVIEFEHVFIGLTEVLRLQGLLSTLGICGVGRMGREACYASLFVGSMHFHRA
jgi:hypothetical protein